jgi:DNA-binding transcriptional ArsR family regulator
MQETYKIKDLEQIRLLSDPLKLQLLRAFAEGEKTTKQVAADLGESITKLYRHVDALHDAGLLEIVQETPKRGTVERTFRAIAQRFEADRSLFADDADEAGINAIRDLLQAGVGEILNALAISEPDAEDTVVVRLRCKGSPERIAAMRQSLTEWIESVQCDVAEDTDDQQEAGALIAFYPLPNDR